ncbi:MAG: class I SAM-dependent methyltransferase, partial [Planctomycetes bacterium]|nr:class I SAM-dependent methyltransferase [Planctomycetota bacterium]
DLIELLRPAGLGSGSRVLDLGCGKGAQARALAREFGCRVDGVDGIPAFVDYATRHAADAGLAAQCRFRQGDVRRVVRRARGYDVVCMLALGDLFGDAAETIGVLRECARPGGLVVLDDAFLRDGVPRPETLVHCFDHATTLALLQSHGDRVIGEIRSDGVADAAEYRAMTAAIAARAGELAVRHPFDAELLANYVAQQRAEVALLEGPVVGAVWLLQRA